MPPARKREPAIPARVKAAIEYMLNTRSDLAEAATHAGLSTYELRRQLGKTHVLKYARAEKKAALEALCLTTPAALNEVLRGENEMAKVAAIKTAEALKEGAVELEQRGAQRSPGLQIVIIERSGEQRVAYQPMPAVPMLDALSAPEAEPVPSFDNRDPGH
jgi:hypothetical protein